MQQNEEDAPISSVAQLVLTVHQRSGLDVGAAIAKDTMRKDCHMKYRRILPISWNQNSEVNLVLR